MEEDIRVQAEPPSKEERKAIPADPEPQGRGSFVPAKPERMAEKKEFAASGVIPSDADRRQGPNRGPKTSLFNT